MLRNGFSPIDAIFLILICAMLSFLVVPRLSTQRETSRRASCSKQMKNIGQAILSFHERTNHLPSAGVVPRPYVSSNELSWHVTILGDLGYQYLLDEFNLGPGAYHSTRLNRKNNPHGLVRIDEYICPSATRDRSVGFQDAVQNNPVFTAHFYGIMGPRGTSPSGVEYGMLDYGPYASDGAIVVDQPRRLKDITDGTTKTYVVGELSWDDAGCYRSWVRGVNGAVVGGSKNIRWSQRMRYFGDEDPADGNAGGFNDVSLGSQHPRGTHLLYADGSARFCNETIDHLVYKGGASISGKD